jgi:hypothetical protein
MRIRLSFAFATLSLAFVASHGVAAEPPPTMAQPAER